MHGCIERTKDKERINIVELFSLQFRRLIMIKISLTVTVYAFEKYIINYRKKGKYRAKEINFQICTISVL